jgi:arylsulfatase A-like enzyme
VVTFAVWLGLVAGLIEAVLRLAKRDLMGQVARVTNDVIWMAPLADVAFLLAPAVLFALALRIRPSPLVFRTALALTIALASLSLLLLESRVALFAKVLIAAGVGLQAARLIAPRAPSVLRLVRRTLPAAVALVAALGVGVNIWSGMRYRRDVVALPAARAGAPNVLLVVLDTVRAQNLSLQGYSRATTPNLERWASSAAVFDRAIAPSPWTFPSHATLFTGRWPFELAIDWDKPLDGRFPTLAGVLRDRGYATAGFSANIFYCTYELGLARGFVHFEDYPISPSQAAVSTSIGRELFAFSLNRDFAFDFRTLIGYDDIPGRRTAAEINDVFLQWQARQDPSRPFFAFLNYLDAHQPFLPSAPFGTKFRGDAPRGDPRHWWDRPWTPDAVQAEVDAYDGAIAYLDDQLGRLFEELRRRGVLDRTLVIVTSDHGEHFGEHGFMRHGNTLYQEVLHVPLVIRYPPVISTPIRVNELATLRDVPATVLDLLGETCPGCLPGRSLAGHWAPDPPGAEPGPPPSPIFAEVNRGVRIPSRYPSSKGDMRSWFSGNLHYILNGDGTEELYDLSVDPNEQHNLARVPEGALRRDRMRRELDAFVQGRRLAPPPDISGRR